MSAVASAPADAPAPPTRRRLDRDDILMRVGICLLIGWMLVTLILPLWWLLSKSFQNQNGEFVGLANYFTYFSTPALFASVWNSVFIAAICKSEGFFPCNKCKKCAAIESSSLSTSMRL